MVPKHKNKPHFLSYYYCVDALYTYCTHYPILRVKHERIDGVVNVRVLHNVNERTLLEVLDVLGGERDADAVHTRLLLAVALHLGVTRHG